MRPLEQPEADFGYRPTVSRFHEVAVVIADIRMRISEFHEVAVVIADTRFQKSTNRFAILSALRPLRWSPQEAVQVKAALVLEQEHGSGGLTTGDSFGGGLGAKAMAAHREMGTPSALPYRALIMFI